MTVRTAIARRDSSETPQLEIPGTTRRDFLRASALLAAFGGAGAAGVLLDAQPAAASRALPAAAGTGAAFVNSNPSLHLLRRATFGVTPGLQRQIKKKGRTAWLEQQLSPSSITDTAIDNLMSSRWSDLSWSIAEAKANLDDGGWDLMFDLGVATLARAAWSKRQLLEVMTDFWSNHLNVTNPSDNVYANRHDYDRTVIRAHALGKFSEMLAASATHPAMMLYLNNAESTKDNPNQNYGRELLELHTVGLDAGYTETDMINSASVMTGFGINWNTYEFHYWKGDHYTGPVQILGWSHPNPSDTGGYAVGLSYVDYLAHHPATASRIAYKLCERFVSDTPPDSLVAALAATYLANDTAIKPVLRQLFGSAEFAGSIGQKVRRPLESIVATVRTLGMKPDVSGVKGMQGLYWMVQDLGNAPLAWAQPNGYPDFADAWRSAGGSLGRWNANIDLAAHWWPKELGLPSLRLLLPKTLPLTYGALVDTLATRLVYRPLDPVHRDAVLTFINKNANSLVHKTDEALGWRFPYLVSLILDSPYHQVR